jgi:hypothetical protein
MYQSESAVMTPKATMSRIDRNVPLKYVAFSGTGGASCVHGKMCPRPANRIRSRKMNATGRKAT